MQRKMNDPISPTFHCVELIDLTGQMRQHPSRIGPQERQQVLQQMQQRISVKQREDWSSSVKCKRSCSKKNQNCLRSEWSSLMAATWLERMCWILNFNVPPYEFVSSIIRFSVSIFHFRHGTRTRSYSIKGIELCIKYFEDLGFAAKAVVPQMRWISEH